MPTFAPGHRLPYERDGSAVYRYNNDGSPAHPTSWSSINDEDDDYLNVHGTRSTTGQGRMAIVFPVQTNIVGYYVANAGSNRVTLEYSSDCTDGMDGTWTSVVTATFQQSVLPTYRTGITAVNWVNVRSVRVRALDYWDSLISAIHLYQAAQQTYLKVWDPTTDVEIPHGLLDWETVYAGETYKKQCRIKNIRSMQANNVSVDVTSYTNTSIDAAYSFSLDDITYARPLNIGNIAAGAISPLVYVRVALPSTQAVTTYATQIHGIPGSWT